MREPAAPDWRAIFDRLISDRGAPLTSAEQIDAAHLPNDRDLPDDDSEPVADGTLVRQLSPRARELEVRLSSSVARAELLVASLAGRLAELESALDRDRHRLAGDLVAERQQHGEAFKAQMAEMWRRHEQRVRDFERDAAALLEAYATSARAADAAVRRAEAKLDAFDAGMKHLLDTATDEIRSAAEAFRGAQAAPAEDAGDRFHALLSAGRPAGWIDRWRGWTMAAIVVAVLAVVYGAYREISTARERADAAERAAAGARTAAEQTVASAAGATQRAVADALALATRSSRMIEIIAAPDARRLDLLGKAAAPAATGQALWSRSRGVILSATRVPPPPAGEVYQVWLSMSTGPVSLGFASPDAQGRVGATFELPPGAAGTVAGFLVSREPAGGSSTPRGVPVLAN